MARFDSLAAWLNWQEQFHPRTIDLGLNRVAEVYRQLELDKVKTPTIIVAGTNGKGSCIAFLEAIYLAGGYKVGAYTSPHILHYNERIRVNAQPASDEQICLAFAGIDQMRSNTSLSYFEFGTLAALSIFAEAQVDVRLLEVGLGGRLDAVNIVDPDLALLTTIAIDHVDWLGNTLEAIGREKAGIFRTGVPAVIGETSPPHSVLQTIAEKQAELKQIGRDFNYQRHDGSWDWYEAGCQLRNLPEPAFKGEHQYRNASAVLMAATALQSILPVSENAIRHGLQFAELQGRYQLIAGENNVLLDVGHNPQAVQNLSDYLQEMFVGVRIHAVFAMMKDKDVAGVLNIMKDRVSVWYLAPLKNPRAASEDFMQNLFRKLDIENVRCGFPDFLSAFDAVRNNVKNGDLILIFGSFFLVSEYLSISKMR
jgi:dihydrofolate synthase/folylpolyglutamate synthase